MSDENEMDRQRALATGFVLSFELSRRLEFSKLPSKQRQHYLALKRSLDSAITKELSRRQCIFPKAYPQ